MHTLTENKFYESMHITPQMSRLMKSPQAPHCQWVRYLPLNVKRQLNPVIDLKKCEHRCQVEKSKSGGQVPSVKS